VHLLAKVNLNIIKMHSTMIKKKAK